jgi:hypothetical protein
LPCLGAFDRRLQWAPPTLACPFGVGDYVAELQAFRPSVPERRVFVLCGWLVQVGISLPQLPELLIIDVIFLQKN